MKQSIRQILTPMVCSLAFLVCATGLQALAASPATMRSDGPVELDSAGWTLSSNRNSGELPLMLDGNNGTRWTTIQPQTPGQELVINLGDVESFDRIVLVAQDENDYPRQYEVSVSFNGFSFTPIATGSGTPGQTVIDFDEQLAVYIKIEQTGSVDFFWWSVSELEIHNNTIPGSVPGGVGPSSPMVHPGLSHKRSDLDRMRHQVEAGIEPWATSFQLLSQNSHASFNYQVRGNPGETVVSRDDPNNNYSDFNNDGLAAYYNALMWYITEDTRHADKCVEIFNTWSNVQRVEADFALDSGRLMWKILEGAEIIKSTYSGWQEADINKFKAMLVYPGFSGTQAPTAAINSNDASFYWYMYQGDPRRHGNQGLFAMRGVMGIGIFLDNEIIYQRALRYLQGLPHRPDDLPYPSGPPVTSPLDTGNIYFNEFRQNSRRNDIEDYGYNEVIANYIYENGQSQESARDQGHGLGGVSIINTMCEMAWSQGDNLYGHLDNRPLSGMNFYFRYNVSFTNTGIFPDQLTPWEPTVESGEFFPFLDRTGRFEALRINPYRGSDLTRFTRGGENFQPIYQMVLGHYRDRMEVAPEDYLWVERGDALSFAEVGVEQRGFDVDHPGWGHLTFHRTELSNGDPINGFTADGAPDFNMSVVPGTIEAENYDYFPIIGNGRTYMDSSECNSGDEYRVDEDVDIDTCPGGLCVIDMEDGEWLNYTISVPEAGAYAVSIRYAASDADGAISVDFAGQSSTGSASLASTGGDDNFQETLVGQSVMLDQGVQSMRVYVEGGGFNLDSISFDTPSPASIDWTVANITSSATDVRNAGETVQAISGVGRNLGTTTVNGVVFEGNTRLLSGSDSSDFFNDIVAGGSYDTLLSTSDLGADSQGTLTINITDLTVGEDYLIQYWYAADSTVTRTMTLTSSSTVETGVGDVVLDNSSGGTGGRYAIGRFTATDTTQGFTVISSANGVRLTAYQVRTDPFEEPLIGDINCDGSVNLFDIAPFIAVLTSGTFEDKADIDRDGDVNLFDIAPFITLLTGI